MNEVDNKAIGRAVDSLLNYETVKYFGAEEREARRYDSAIAAYTVAATRNETSLAWLNIGQSFITNLMMAGAMGFTVWGWAQGRFTPGDVVLVNSLLMQLFRPLDMLGWVYRSIRQGLIDMEAMFDLTDTPAEVVDRPGAPPLQVARGHVRLEDVHFGYEPERQILKGVTLDVPPGTSVAVVGPSGAGKSTLARLLYRFYDPQGGRITIDGQDIREVAQGSLRAAIGIVPQDTVLFNDTIGYNIGYGRDGASQEEILKNPPILILDEATSALDSRTEEAILGTLDAIAANRTTITIAHRLSTVVGADQIVVLDDGRVAERGTHAELLRKGSLYADMWARQQAEREMAEAAE
jgi:ATP-binding cassette subfamily B protein